MGASTKQSIRERRRRLCYREEGGIYGSRIGPAGAGAVGVGLGLIRTLPLSRRWDLGLSDHTAIWLADHGAVSTGWTIMPPASSPWPITLKK